MLTVWRPRNVENRLLVPLQHTVVNAVAVHLPQKDVLVVTPGGAMLSRGGEAERKKNMTTARESAMK